MESLKELVARVLGVDKSTLNDQSSPENTENWDSFNALILVSELEENFSVNFSIEDVVAVKNFADIKKALKRHGVKNGIND